MSVELARLRRPFDLPAGVITARALRALVVNCVWDDGQLRAPLLTPVLRFVLRHAEVGAEVAERLDAPTA